MWQLQYLSWVMHALSVLGLKEILTRGPLSPKQLATEATLLPLRCLRTDCFCGKGLSLHVMRMPCRVSTSAGRTSLHAQAVHCQQLAAGMAKPLAGDDARSSVHLLKRRSGWEVLKHLATSASTRCMTMSLTSMRPAPESGQAMQMYLACKQDHNCSNFQRCT